MRSKRLFNKALRSLTLVFVVLSISSVIEAKNLGLDGATYQIAEPDALAEIEKRASSADWSKIMNRDMVKTAVRTDSAAVKINLPRAVETRTRNIDMTYTLEMDIPDDQGRILYPKGFVFNPLDYLPPYPFTKVIINGQDPEQVTWFKKKYDKDIKVKLILVNGSSYDLSQELGRPVFYAHQRMIERLKLEKVPSVIKQKGRMMEVIEIDVSAELKEIVKN